MRRLINCYARCYRRRLSGTTFVQTAAISWNNPSVATAAVSGVLSTWSAVFRWKTSLADSIGGTRRPRPSHWEYWPDRYDEVGHFTWNCYILVFGEIFCQLPASGMLVQAILLLADCCWSTATSWEWCVCAFLGEMFRPEIRFRGSFWWAIIWCDMWSSFTWYLVRHNFSDSGIWRWNMPLCQTVFLGKMFRPEIRFRREEKKNSRRLLVALCGHPFILVRGH